MKQRLRLRMNATSSRSATTRSNRELWNHPVIKSIQRFLGHSETINEHQPRFSILQTIFSFIGAFLGIATLAYLSVYTQYPLLAAPFGATAVLVFAVPESPLAQPRNVVIGNCLGATISILLVHFFGIQPWVEALAVATTIKLMQLTKTIHPPAGAVALVGVMSHASWSFLFTPVLAGSLITVGCTLGFNNFISKRKYPKHWL